MEREIEEPQFEWKQGMAISQFKIRIWKKDGR